MAATAAAAGADCGNIGGVVVAVVQVGMGLIGEDNVAIAANAASSSSVFGGVLCSAGEELISAYNGRGRVEIICV